MTALLQFKNVITDRGEPLSFTMIAGEIRLLKAGTQDRLSEIIDLVLGDLAPAQGEILLRGQSLDMFKPGTVGWIPAHGGLISNLKTWENITLPLWYHNKRQIKDTEDKVIYWLRELAIDSETWEAFMSSPVARLKPDEHKRAGLLRGLVLSPELLVIDAGLFDEVDAANASKWIAILEKYVTEVKGRAVLLVAGAVTSLPWKIIE